jgi:CheY-like chemotaxis protein
MPSACILVIEDEAHVRALVQRILERGDLEVLAAADGPGGIALFTKHSARIDLVLLDLHMPGIDGLETLQELTRIRPDVRAVLMSGLLPDLPNPPAALVGVIQKPFRPAQLISCITEKLGR